MQNFKCNGVFCTVEWYCNSFSAIQTFVLGYWAYSMQDEDLTRQNENENKTGPRIEPWGTPAGSG